MPEDVLLLHDALLTLLSAHDAVTLNLANCGTAMRFLTAFCASRPMPPVVLTGNQRMLQRPVSQLVDVLREAGADIEYLQQEGFPPLKIQGQMLPSATMRLPAPLSSQFVSAMMLVGLKVATDCRSPYISITRTCLENYNSLRNNPIENDWSAAAFWYEWLALHPQAGELFLQGLLLPSVQGDSAVTDIFLNIGVETEAVAGGVVIRAVEQKKAALNLDFSLTPDLYPAVAMTCHALCIRLQATGTQALRIKESDRLAAIKDILAGSRSTRHDHRIAMALLAADMPADDIDCIRKSYPQFVQQLQAADNELHRQNICRP